MLPKTVIPFYQKMYKIYEYLCKIVKNSLVTLTFQNLVSDNYGGNNQPLGKSLYFRKGKYRKFEKWLEKLCTLVQNCSYNEYRINRELTLKTL